MNGDIRSRRVGAILIRRNHALLARHFRGQSDLVLIAIPAAILGDALKWEASRGGDLFPHLYSALRTDLATYEVPLDSDEEGVPIMPEQVFAC